ncbi:MULTISPECIES: helicase HerA domain-containing protein [unclassified Shewanella]|uniref:ATP-binding protein n=1 Tax=unclassified Shewanella TaxID=196818 RepID=UPI003551AE38
MKKPLIELLKNIELQTHMSTMAKIEKPAFLQDYEFSLYHIKEVTFDEESPRKEAFENVLSSLSIEGILFTYLLVGDSNGVSFYFGIAKDKQYKKPLQLDVDDIGDTILKPAIEGNFRGSSVEKLGKKQRLSVKAKLSQFQHIAKLEGVPSVNEENEEFQGVDRLIDIMSGDDFCLAIMADPLSLFEINAIEQHLHTIHDKLSPLAKQSIQTGENSSSTSGVNQGSNTSKANGQNTSKSITMNTGTNNSTTQGTSDNANSGKSTSKSGTKGSSDGRSDGDTKGTSVTTTSGESVGSSTSEQTGQSNTTSREFSDKSLQEWLTYIDDVLLKRVHYGKNKGLYLSSIYLFSNVKGTVLKLGNTARSLFSGGGSNKSPLTFKEVTNEREIFSIQNLQFPRTSIDAEKKIAATKDSHAQLAILLSKSPFEHIMGNWLSTNELSVVAGLPQKEVVGLTLKEEVEFGLNVPQKEDENKLFLGSLVKSGLLQNIDVCLDKRDLDKHTFIAGVTGSGKTTTCQRLLQSAEMPFLVIEPAKTEYRVLTKKQKDIIIFTLGNDNVAPFRLNPFEFFPHENITSRVDMLKASIESAFDMEAAIPQLIEAAIYKCYEAKGWNIATSKNSKHVDPFADGVYAFPTLSELVKMTEVVVAEQGFDDRLKQDYIGSIKARLQGLLIGSKGLMLDTPRSIDFKDLATKNVILELEEIRNPSEKSLIMGFVLANLNEAIRANYEEYRRRGERYKHITLIEEAHRLLSKFEPGDSQNKKQGVETFADMLAEVRKYGEALIIVDQIPNKLTPEVLKNTSTKIIHKLFAKDDKEAVGNTMALTDEQKSFLSNLEPGRVILSSSGINKPLQVQVKELVSTTTESEVDASDIRLIALDYYAQHYKRGLIKGLEFYAQQPTQADVEYFLQCDLMSDWFETVNSQKATQGLINSIATFDKSFLVNFILTACYFDTDTRDRETQVERLTQYLTSLQTDIHTRIDRKLNHAFRKNIKDN